MTACVLDEIKSNPVDWRRSALEVVLAEVHKHPEKTELLLRVCIAVSEVDGEIPTTDQIEIVRLCGELGVRPGDFKFYTGPGSVLLEV
ncbi:MAG: tellurite resistance TerB family protein [Gammaproteobacteria bacterium]|nr:tellurite resistance TerB family protein [Gammaproteobacteria bacterium]